MASFGELVLVLGDMHIPERATSIPSAFSRMLVAGKMQHVISTGHVDTRVASTWAPNLCAVAGNHDDNSLPETAVTTVGAFRIGVVNGNPLLREDMDSTVRRSCVDRWRRKLQADILITGHTSEAAVTVDEDAGYYHISPVRYDWFCIVTPTCSCHYWLQGSITGAFSPFGKASTPSFVLLAIQDTKVVCYVYELQDENVEVTKTEFEKKAKSSQSTSSATNTALLDSLLK